jgi:peroxiredoxin
VELQSRLKEVTDRGLGLAVISYDPPDILEAFSRQRGITFPLLSDARSETIKRYGILNTVAMELAGPNAKDPALSDDINKYVFPVAGANARLAGIAFPGTFVLDRTGRVKSRFFEDFYVERNTVSSILMRDGGGVPVAGTKISTARLDITTYPSDTAIAPGNRITLAFDIVPHRGIHVYAPGASGYRVIALTLESPSPIRALPMIYPPSQIYEFKPLNERVPVYEKPFTLRQEVILEGTPQARAVLRGKDSLTVNGTLAYQACDDKICFTPESVPVSWTFTLRPVVFERPGRGE